jgi:hypothetical protein
MVNRIVREETATWVVEFQTVVRQSDDLAKIKVDRTAPPGVNVTVTNGQCDPRVVEVNGRHRAHA